MKKTIFFLVSITILISCDSFDFAGFIVGQSPEVNKRFSQSMKNNEANPYPDITASSDDYTLILLTDIHYKASNDHIKELVAACLAESTSEELVLALGDYINGKDLEKEFVSKLQPLFDAGWSFYPAIGNHDLYFGGWENYEPLWHTSTYKFTVRTPSAGTDLFICLDSAEGTLGTEQRKWVEDVLADAQNKSYRHITVLTHTHFFKRDNSQGTTGNFGLEETFDLLSLFARYNVDYVLTGHDHYYEHTLFRDVDYYILNAFSNDKHSYYLGTFGKELKLEEKFI